ncbi:MAG TPA: hypothetical protein VFV87_15785 [Pirellulaceae bacterium]|nr:hypothetical protein [Pirellulaceae bacterium]
MILPVRWWLLTFLLLVPAVDAAAESLDARLLADARDGRLDEFDFLSACLIAGGVSDPAELAEATSEAADVRARLDLASLRELPPLPRARELHDRLHARILQGTYRQDASDLRLALRGEAFNCLSALALYCEFGREAGLDLEIWSQPGHVYLVERASGARNDPASHQSAARAESAARQLTPVQLVGKFYYNCGVLALKAGRYEEGVSLVRRSLQLDPLDGEAQKNLLAGLNNWAVDLCRHQRYAAARELIEAGLAIDAGFEPLVANARYVTSKSGQ